MVHNAVLIQPLKLGGYQQKKPYVCPSVPSNGDLSPLLTVSDNYKHTYLCIGKF